mgnify:CR=1 FL=1
MTHTPKDAGISWKIGSRNEASAGTSFFREELKFVEILKNISGRVRLSPNGKYAYGYNPVDSIWFAVNLTSKKLKKLTSDKVFYDELMSEQNSTQSE